MTRRGRIATAAVAALIIALSACHDRAAGNADAERAINAEPDNIAAKAPPIYLEQTVVVLQDGQPTVEKNYREALADCLKVPQWPARPLAEDIVKKLGRTYIKTQFDGRRMASRVDTWGFTESEAPHICQFYPTHEASVSIIEPGVATTIDLIKHKRKTNPSDGVVRYPPPPVGGDEASRKAKVAELLRQRGYDQAAGDVTQPSIRSSEAGQPCALKHTSLADICMWSGGRQWGFSTDGTALLDGRPPAMDSIQLRRDPAKGTGFRWRTTRMIVGGHNGDTLFEASRS